MDVVISHFQSAVKYTKRCVKSHKIAHETPKNRLPLGLRQAPQILAGKGDTPFPPHSSPLDAFDRCSWTFK